MNHSMPRIVIAQDIRTSMRELPPRILSPAALGPDRIRLHLLSRARLSPPAGSIVRVTAPTAACPTSLARTATPPPPPPPTMTTTWTRQVPPAAVRSSVESCCAGNPGTATPQLMLRGRRVPRAPPDVRDETRCALSPWSKAYAPPASSSEALPTVRYVHRAVASRTFLARSSRLHRNVADPTPCRVHSHGGARHYRSLQPRRLSLPPDAVARLFILHHQVRAQRRTFLFHDDDLQSTILSITPERLRAWAAARLCSSRLVLLRPVGHMFQSHVPRENERRSEGG